MPWNDNLDGPSEISTAIPQMVPQTIYGAIRRWSPLAIGGPPCHKCSAFPQMVPQGKPLHVPWILFSMHPKAHPRHIIQE